ncbi:hypothetical protein PTE30175_00142 [Pandoraea terrae]|uniref:Uncharacterized protein n=1 Tax=Pandoraea terrae TaxID=1537710 RepID=A0A5E4RIL8_9BURK|nr:hypothetical protein PTE30175_00142 [Pandoraea terrae]
MLHAFDFLCYGNLDAHPAIARTSGLTPEPTAIKRPIPQ